MEQNSQTSQYNVTNPESYVMPQENYPNFIAQQIANEIPRSAIVSTLIEKGLDSASANEMYNNVETQFDDVKRSAAKSDIIWGGVWLVGGVVVTISGIGLIAWGAIIFGGIQMVKGLINYNNV